MYARLFALICVLYVSVSPGQGQFLGSGDVAVYLKTSSEHSSASLQEMKAELEKLMRPVGVRLNWWDVHQKPAASPRVLVVLELRGVCDAAHQVPPRPLALGNSSLGSSAVAEGQILPFSWVECDALTRFIGHSVADLPAAARDFAYGRAMARLAAHEVYHVLSRESGHAESGIAKAQFTASDLLADRFEFEGIVLASDRRARNVETIAPGVVIDVGNEK